MFRQTLVRAALGRGLDAGATNLPNGEVAFTLAGEVAAVDALVAKVVELDTLNDWGAAVSDLVEERAGTAIAAHQVTTENVDRIPWTDGVQMYL